MTSRLESEDRISDPRGLNIGYLIIAVRGQSSLRQPSLCTVMSKQLDLERQKYQQSISVFACGFANPTPPNMLEK